jgi:hypothetical protein
MERRARKEQKRQETKFFYDVRNNILASLARGELIPGVQRQSAICIPKEPLLPLDERALLVRTISGMNEQLLAEVRNKVPVSSTSQIVAAVSKPAIVSGVPQDGYGRPPLPSKRSSFTSEELVEVSSDFSKTVSMKVCSDALDDLRGERLFEADRDSDFQQQFPLARNSDTGSPGGTHVRRNTGGTIYVKSTMENPDIKATIKCVCAVYRAHIVSASLRKNQRSPVSVTTANVNLDIFRDDYETPSQRNTGVLNKNTMTESSIPSVDEIEQFYLDFFERSQMEQDTIIMSLIYAERLIKVTNGVLTPATSNWRSLLFSTMVLSSKVWDDLSMFNLDFSNVSRLCKSGLNSFSLQRTNALELAVLTSLNFDVKVLASEYAKYYFLIRTMLSRGGLLDGAHMPLSRDEYKALEYRTSQFQDSFMEDNNRERRTRSVDWHTGKVIEPAPRDTVCLEQLVSMSR